MSDPMSNRPEIHPDAVAALRKLREEKAEFRLVRWAYREAAAVLDSFALEMLKPFNMDSTQGGYHEYAEDAEPILLATEKRWRLRAEIRHDALQRLSTRTQMKAALNANQVRPDTPVQRMLEKVIDGEIPELAGLTREELQALLVVHRWLEGILGPHELPDYEAVASAFSRADLLSPFKYLVSHGFVDRTRELGQLHEFLWADRPTAPVLILYGIGGVGKSCLLAEFILEEVEHCADRLLLVPLDADRPDIDPERPHTFLIEAVRQIARQRQNLSTEAEFVVQSLRELGSSLNRQRDYYRGLKESRYSEKDVYYLRDEFARIFSQFISRAQPEVANCRVLITIDTFEEVQVYGDEVVSSLMRLFLDIIRNHSGVRIVLSGRIRANERFSFPDELLTNPPTIYLTSLDQDSALSLLRRLIDAKKYFLGNELEEVLSMVGRNPMCLRLAARVIENEGPEALLDDKTRHKLLKRIEDEKIQAFLFGRILDHFHSEHIVPLAYPGLIVRRITPEVIREVLAGPCGLDLRDASASDLYRDLERERTMVEPDVEEGLRYRPDLRRELLPDVLLKVSPEVAEEIDRRAVQFYSVRPGLPARAEQLYHCLRLGQPTNILESMWDPKLREYLKGSLPELPIAGQLWLAGKLNITLDAGTRGQADQETWEDAAALRAERYLRDGETEKALSALHERSERLPGSRLYRLEADALRLYGRDQEALDMAVRGLTDAPAAIRVDLLLFAGLIHESRNELAAALSTAEEALILAKDSNDRMLYLRALITKIRLLRKLARKAERNVLREEALTFINPQTLLELENYPRLLEEIAAELGPTSEAILNAAVKRLGVHAKSEEQEDSLASAFHALASGDLVERAKQSVKIDPKIIEDMKSSFEAAKEVVKQSKGAGLGELAADLLKNKSIHEKASRSFTDFFRQGVDQVIQKK